METEPCGSHHLRKRDSLPDTLPASKTSPAPKFVFSPSLLSYLLKHIRTSRTIATHVTTPPPPPQQPAPHKPCECHEERSTESCRDDLTPRLERVVCNCLIPQSSLTLLGVSAHAQALEMSQTDQDAASLSPRAAQHQDAVNTMTPGLYPFRKKPVRLKG